MIDAAHALDFLGHAVLVTLEPDTAARLEVDGELAGVVHAVIAEAIGLALPVAGGQDEFVWLPLSAVDDIEDGG